MSDFPRPAKSMSAPLNGFAPSHRPARAGMVALALAATMLPGAHALAHGRAVAARVPASQHNSSPAKVHGGVAAGRRIASPASAKTATKHSPGVARSARMDAPKVHPRMIATQKRYQAVPAVRGQALPVAATANRQSHAPLHPTATDLLVDRSTEDRVHAWYRARSAGSYAAPSASDEAFANNTPERAVTPSMTAPASRKQVPMAQPDLSLVPRKATVADFDRAAQKQAETNRAAIAQKNTRSTADDDAAFALASNIPSTAPTEREPSPFIHGDLLGATVRDVNPPKPATLSAKPEAAIVTRVDPRGDAEVLSASASTTAPAGIHVSLADAMPTPKIAPILRSSAPAASAVTAAANKPRLDPHVADSMAQQSLQDDSADLSPSAGKVATGALPAKAAAAGGYAVDLNGGPLVKVNLYDNAGKLILLPAMKGSHEILVHQNQMAIADGLDRVEDDNQLLEMRRLKLLVALPDTDGMYPDGRLPQNRRYARPWTVRFLNDLSRAHFERFHTPLIVTSAVRTVAFQRRLVLTNGNAAPPTGEVASPHLYGQAIDIAKHGMSMTEIAWMRAYLTPVETAGKIDVEEEFQQACFHMSVYRRYLGLPAPRNTPTPEVAPSRVFQQVKAAPAKHRHIPTALLATGLR